MTEIDLPLPAHATSSAVICAVERACGAAGLRASMKTTLASYPGSTHWHFKAGTDRGTLECTWWPDGRGCGSVSKPAARATGSTPPLPNSYPRSNGRCDRR